MACTKQMSKQNAEIQQYLAKRLKKLNWSELRKQLEPTGGYSKEGRDVLELLRNEIVAEFGISKDRSYTQIAKASRLRSNR